VGWGSDTNQRRGRDATSQQEAEQTQDQRLGQTASSTPAC
jgi:hypothetical protein